MSTFYNIDYDVAACILLLLEIIYVRIQYVHDKYNNRLFIMLLHSCFLFSLVDIVSSLFLTVYINVVPSGLLRFVSSLYFLVNAVAYLVYYRYVVEYLGHSKEKTVAYYVRTYFPFIFIVECLVANHFANILFSGGKYGHYSYGSLILIIYVYPLYYIILTLIVFIRKRKEISLKQVISLSPFMLFVVVSVAYQLVNPDVSILSFGYALSILIMIFALETPDYKKMVKATDTISAIRDEIEQQEAFNKAFIEDMAYEISAPIGKLLDRNEELPVDSLDDEQRELREYVSGYGRMVRTVINDMIEFTTPGGIGNDIYNKDYSITDAVETVRKMMSPVIADKSVDFNVSVSPNLPSRLNGAEMLVKQIIINLLSNSIRFTNSGMIALSVNYRRIDPENMNLIISVEDTGAGMDRDMVKNLMRFNTKGRDFKKEAYDSNSFRLRITKKMIDQLNGKLHIDSSVGKGSIFTVIIPQGISEQ